MRLVRPRVLVVALGLVAGCASVSAPPGGPIDHVAPQVAEVSIDTNATNVTAGKLEIRFDEVISERPAAAGPASGGGVTLDAVVIVSPRTGSAKVEWHRDRITIEPRGGFRANTTYRVTLLPGIADIRGNIRTTPMSIVFTTGPTILPFAILGRVFDWQQATPAPGAVIEAVANAGTPDSLIYLAVADSAGQFDLGPFGAGKYLVRTFIDIDHNRERGVLEKWDTVTVDVTDHRPSIELLAIQRDTAAIGVQRVEVLDSGWVRVLLDKPFDPRTTLLPAMIVLRRADSSDVQVQSVLTEAEAASLRIVRGATPPSPVSAPPAQATDLPSIRPQAPRPAIPSPLNSIVLRLNAATPLKPGEKYHLVVRGLRNLLGRTGTSDAVFDFPLPTRPPG